MQLGLTGLTSDVCGHLENKRDYHGYAQFRDGAASSWKLRVTGFDETFDGQNGQCTVLCSDGSEKWVDIDDQSRITLFGQYFDWVH